MILLLLFALLLGSTPTWADVGFSGAAPVGKKFTFRLRGEPETLDWNRAHTPKESNILLNIMEGLVTFDSNSRVMPALAASWTVSPDEKVYTFKLRPGVKWSDDVPLKAADFVYSWKRLLSPVTAAPYAYFLFDIEGAEAYSKGKLQDFNQVGVKALDESTLEVRLAHPLSYWINIPGFWVTFPLRQDVVEKFGNDWAKPGRMVTLGPYSVETHDIGARITLRANANYYGIRGNVDEIVGLIVRDDKLALTLYGMGKIDFLADLAAFKVTDPDQKADLRVFPRLKTQILGFSVDKYPLSNVKVRRAIGMAIDKRKIAGLLSGEEQAATTLVPPGLTGYSKTTGLAFNPTLAQAELKASGVLVSGDLSVDYYYPGGDKSKAITDFVRDELKKNLGITVNLREMGNTNYQSQLDMQAFPLFRYSWSADYPDPDNFLSAYLSHSDNSHVNWKNPVFDELVRSARSIKGIKEREKQYLLLQKILLEEGAVIVPLYYEPSLVLVHRRVKTFEFNSSGYLFLRRVNVS